MNKARVILNGRTNDLIERLAATTAMDFNEAAALVNRGVWFGMTTAEMGEFGVALPDAVQGAALGLTVKQLLGWKDKLPLLILAVRRLGVRPSDVPETPSA